MSGEGWGFIVAMFLIMMGLFFISQHQYNNEVLADAKSENARIVERYVNGDEALVVAKPENARIVE